MSQFQTDFATPDHSHVFLGEGHERSERRTWVVIWLCVAVMVVEIAGGLSFGSLALIADGLHMSTHAIAFVIAALAYTYARKHAENRHFTFGTGKLGDLAGFTSAIILAMIAILIGYEAVDRIIAPIAIDFREAIPIAALGLAVNIASAWLLRGEDHHHHGHSHGHAGGHEASSHRVKTRDGTVALEVFEDGVPPRFRLRFEDWNGATPPASALSVEIERPDGRRQTFALAPRSDHLESIDDIPEPHEFKARLRIAVDGTSDEHVVTYSEQHDHGHANDAAHRDNNMRAAFVHVLADAAVSVLVIAGLTLGSIFGWRWLDPLVGIVGAFVIANWSYGLIRDTGAILLDMIPDRRLAADLRSAIENDGDRLADLHLWRLGPGHLGVIASVVTSHPRGPDYYRQVLARFPSLSHVTVEVHAAGTA
jgi:cation diffusion facilitator family transporter